jgi:hypothetical protein
MLDVPPARLRSRAAPAIHGPTTSTHHLFWREPATDAARISRLACVSESSESGAVTGDTEEVDALVVLPEARTLVVEAPSRAMVPVAQAAAVAAGGFVAGAAVVGLVSRRRARPRGRVSARRRRGKEGALGAELWQIVGSRSLLVDVHLLGGRDTGH